MDKAVSKKILIPANQLRLKSELEEEYNEGIISERTRDILTPRHVANIED